MPNDDRPRLIAATFRLPPEILDGLDKVKQRDGVSQSEQVRRALRVSLKARKALPAQKKRRSS